MLKMKKKSKSAIAVAVVFKPAVSLLEIVADSVGLAWLRFIVRGSASKAFPKKVTACF